MTAYKDLRDKIESMSNERNDFIALEDGYYYFWPTRNLGAISAAELRILANILDDKNKEWDAQVHTELSKEQPT